MWLVLYTLLLFLIHPLGFNGYCGGGGKTEGETGTMETTKETEAKT
jgi:hypothetical protein